MIAQIPRRSRALIAAAVASLALGACADSTSPTLNSGYITSAAAVASPAVLSNGTIDFKAMYPKLSTQVPSKKMQGDTVIEKFTVNPPDGKLISFAKSTGHVIAIPGNTLCDPTKNAYGPSEWMKPCVLAKSSISFEVHSWSDAQGRPHMAFKPDIRFSPTAPDPVRIYFADTGLTSFSNVLIPFCDSANNCVNEEATDSALTTYATPHPSGGYWVYRMLRHFSGYNVTAF